MLHQQKVTLSLAGVPKGSSGISAKLAFQRCMLTGRNIRGLRPRGLRPKKKSTWLAKAFRGCMHRCEYDDEVSEDQQGHLTNYAQVSCHGIFAACMPQLEHSLLPGTPTLECLPCTVSKGIGLMPQCDLLDHHIRSSKLSSRTQNVCTCGRRKTCLYGKCRPAVTG
eukprot:scaffold235701_cov21-Tisochrysis_lutea.AAC.1